MQRGIAKLAAALLGTLLIAAAIWVGAGFVLSCTGTTPIDFSIPWEQRDDDGDGYLNPNDSHPQDPYRHDDWD